MAIPTLLQRYVRNVQRNSYSLELLPWWLGGWDYATTCILAEEFRDTLPILSGCNSGIDYNQVVKWGSRLRGGDKKVLVWENGGYALPNKQVDKRSLNELTGTPKCFDLAKYLAKHSPPKPIIPEDKYTLNKGNPLPCFRIIGSEYPFIYADIAPGIRIVWPNLDIISKELGSKYIHPTKFMECGGAIEEEMAKVRSLGFVLVKGADNAQERLGNSYEA